MGVWEGAGWALAQLVVEFVRESCFLARPGRCFRREQSESRELQRVLGCMAKKRPNSP